MRFLKNQYEMLHNAWVSTTHSSCDSKLHIAVVFKKNRLNDYVTCTVSAKWHFVNENWISHSVRDLKLDHNAQLRHALIINFIRDLVLFTLCNSMELIFMDLYDMKDKLTIWTYLNRHFGRKINIVICVYATYLHKYFI